MLTIEIYSFEDVLQFVGVSHDNEERGVLISIDGSCASVQLSRVFVFWPKVPNLHKNYSQSLQLPAVK